MIKALMVFILSYSSLFSQWRTIDTGSESNLINITFIDSINGWVLGDKSILHTSDGGETWVKQKEVDSLKYRQIVFLDNKIGFVFGNGILRTTDGGVNWNPHNWFLGNYFIRADFCNDSTGWLIANREENLNLTEFVFKTNDRGLTWDTLLIKNDIIRFYDIKFVDSSNGYIIGSDGHDNFAPIYIYKTIDGGKIWTNTSVFIGAHTFYLSAVNKDTLWTGGLGFAKSFDGGVTWDTYFEIINEDSVLYGQPRFYDFFQINNNKGYAVIITNKKFQDVDFNLCYTDDSGTSWTRMETPIGFKPLCVTVINKYIFSGGVDGKIITNKSSTVDIKERVEYDLPFELYDNYPNPFNPSTTITFSLRESSFILLKIYNVLGIEIKTLLREYKQQGFYKIKWNGTDNNNKQVSSGIYIISISNNIYSKRNKSILIK